MGNEILILVIVVLLMFSLVIKIISRRRGYIKCENMIDEYELICLGMMVPLLLIINFFLPFIPEDEKKEIKERQGESE